MKAHWEASPDDIERVAAWAEAELRSGVPDGDVVETTGRRSWEHRHQTVSGVEFRGVAVYKPTSKKLPGTAPRTMSKLFSASTRTTFKFRAVTFSLP